MFKTPPIDGGDPLEKSVPLTTKAACSHRPVQVNSLSAYAGRYGKPPALTL
jgi:hypothetical protein